MKKNLAFPLLALLGGCGAFALRLLQRRTGFEPETGLPIPGCLWGGLLTGTLILAAVLALLLTRTLPAAPRGTSFSQALSTRSTGVLCLLTGGVFLLAVSGVGELLEGLGISSILSRKTGVDISSGLVWPGVSRSGAVLGLLSLLSAACLFSAALNCRQGGRRQLNGPQAAPFHGALLLVPPVHLVVRLVAAYRTYSIDPVLSGYHVELLALILLTLAFYQLSAFAFQAGRPRRFSLWAALAVLLCMATLADRHPLHAVLLYVGSALVLLAFLLMCRQAPSQAEVSA